MKTLPFVQEVDVVITYGQSCHLWRKEAEITADEKRWLFCNVHFFEEQRLRNYNMTITREALGL